MSLGRSYELAVSFEAGDSSPYRPDDRTGPEVLTLNTETMWLRLNSM